MGQEPASRPDQGVAAPGGQIGNDLLQKILLAARITRWPVAEPSLHVAGERRGTTHYTERASDLESFVFGFLESKSAFVKGQRA